jgi:hypothetical protein
MLYIYAREELHGGPKNKIKINISVRERKRPFK